MNVLSIWLFVETVIVSLSFLILKKQTFLIFNTVLPHINSLTKLLSYKIGLKMCLYLNKMKQNETKI